MKALITGASSGIGRELARVLAPRCSRLILTGRDTRRLEALKEELSAHTPLQVETFAADLSSREVCIRLHDAYPDVDLLVNNAGFGDFGPFWETSLEKELGMIETNIMALHILTKLYLADMVRRDSGQILNVASIAGFLPGPLMATYYATKAYVVRLSEAVRKELKARGSQVKISILCPGPVNTGFPQTANISFHFHGMDARKVAEYTLAHLDRFYIVPGFSVCAARILASALPSSLLAEAVYFLQNRRANP